MIKEMKNKCTQKENMYLAHCVQNCLLGNKAWEDVAGFVLSVTNETFLRDRKPGPVKFSK